MGTWDVSLKGNDTFLDIYQTFFDLYNQGQNPTDISFQILKDFKETFNDIDDKNNALFGLALAQWETKSLDPTIYKKVKTIIETGNDLEVWEALDADKSSLKKRGAILKAFLTKISVEKDKPKRRVNKPFDFKTIVLIRIAAPDNKKVFEASEYYVNGEYTQTGSGISWDSGGGSVFYFTERGQFVSARWLDSQTLEVTHNKNIVFTKKADTFFFCGDEGKIIYVATALKNAL